MFRRIARGLYTVVTKLTQVLRVPSTDKETETQVVSRRALATLVAITAGLAGGFPGIHKDCALRIQKRLAEVAKELWDNPPPNYGEAS